MSFSKNYENQSFNLIELCKGPWNYFDEIFSGNSFFISDDIFKTNNHYEKLISDNLYKMFSLLAYDNSKNFFGQDLNNDFWSLISLPFERISLKSKIKNFNLG